MALGRMKNRSISQRISRARSKTALLEIVSEWSDSWNKEQTDIIDRLGKAISQDDFDTECICLGELRAITEKRFSGLKNALIKMVERINDESNT